MTVLRSILVVLSVGSAWLCADLPRRGRATGRLQLALAPEEAKAHAGSKLTLPAPPAFDFKAGLARLGEPEGEPFRPHTSMVEKSPAAVNARELLKRVRSRVHGSVSLGIDSEGNWDTRLALHKQLLPDLLLEMGFSVGRANGRDHDSEIGWDASLWVHKQLRPNFSLEIGFTVARVPDWDHDGG